MTNQSVMPHTRASNPTPSTKTKDYYYVYANYIEKVMQYDSAHDGSSQISSDRGVMRHIQSVTVGPDGTVYINGDDSSYKVIPVNGKSAYELAVDHSFEGTEEEWLEYITKSTGYYDFNERHETDDEVIEGE